MPLWDCFIKTPGAFPDFFHLVLDACSSDIQVSFYPHCFVLGFWVSLVLFLTGKGFHFERTEHVAHFLSTQFQHLGERLLACVIHMVLASLSL